MSMPFPASHMNYVHIDVEGVRVVYTCMDYVSLYVRRCGQFPMIVIQSLSTVDTFRVVYGCVLYMYQICR